MQGKLTLVSGIAASALFVGAVVGVMVYLDLHQEVRAALGWIHAQGPLAHLIFIVIMAVVIVLLLPGVFFTTAAGFVFGIGLGTLYVVVGTTAGAAIAFFLARKLAGQRSRNYILTRPRMQLLDQEITLKGWQVVLLTRLIPFFPFKLSNYFFGLTSVSARHFLAGTAIGIIPLSLHNVWLGAMARTATEVDQPPALLMQLVGFGVIVIAVVVFGRIAVRVLEKKGIEEPR